ncbi:sodium-dependent transporter [Eggerthellaceae bacterium zg-887]|uniref:sodium-dependent transporter n=1 Tax=Xiamenia xianingshaonis TaxID=2682776 RepID=UPI0013E9B147|nr:sodium-dependent transporter [Xiamenia xianingshaonis]NGM17911.1 sodium-dependent transporter [Eggerthellaceae bacterium zg-893]NHM16377.1 sodium-dependent transporter [Xiamenia xianingshaonis]
MAETKRAAQTAQTESGATAGSTEAGSASVAERERFGSRLGFILISAGCAIGLGNVWRFPYIVGEYGGAAFVVLYLVFLVVLGLPVMVMEFAVGRASQRSSALAFDQLQPSGKWHWFSWWGYLGCLVLMMFYTTVGGWMLAFVVKMGTGQFTGLSSAEVGGVFSAMLANPTEMVGWMLAAILLGFLVCSMGLQKGVERITKVMMVCLLAIMLVLVVRAVTLPGGVEGLAFYLIPDFGKLFAGTTSAEQWATFGDAVFAAMGQAFFTLSLGISAMEIFGSYIGKERSLTGEAVRICGLDTAVAIVAGLIIFPACFAFAVEPDSGPGLVFITLPSVFSQMPLGQLWGSLFFVFMSFAAMSTIIGVFENLISWSIDKWGWSRKQAVVRTAVLVTVLSLPCALGFNVLSGVSVPGIGDIQSIEDFVVSNNLLPLGSLLYVVFCTTRGGWGWKNFLAEADEGVGMKFPAWARGWVKFGVPTLIAVIFVMGWIPLIGTWVGA